MSKSELASQYVDYYRAKEIDRRAFIRLMAGLGLSAVAASIFAATAYPAFARGKGKGKGKGKGRNDDNGNGNGDDE